MKQTVWDPDVTSLPIRGESGSFPVRRIYCVGRNYVEHIREMKEGDERDDPFFFQKPTDAVVLDGGVVPYPPATQDLQYEAELVLAIGAVTEQIESREAPERIYGLAAGIDMTRRDRQRDLGSRGLPWEAGKSFDASAPVGMLTLMEDLQGADNPREMRLWVNGEVRQAGQTDQMIWSATEIVARLSADYTLHPGDLVFTGTPAGVGPVVPGDSIHVQVSGLESLTVSVGPATFETFETATSEAAS